MRIICSASRKTRRLWILVLGSLFPTFGFTGTSDVRILSQSSQEMVIQIRFPRLGEHLLASNDSLRAVGLDLIAAANAGHLPARTIFLPPGSTARSLEVLNTEMSAETIHSLAELWQGWNSQTVQWGDSLFQYRAAAVGADPPSIDRLPIAEVKEIGVFRSQPVQAVHVFPFVIGDDGVARVLRTVTLRLVFEQNDKRAGLTRTVDDRLSAELFLKDVVPAARRTPRIAGLDSQQTNRAQIKMLVSRDGIYRITYEDLIQAGAKIPPQLDPWDLRVTCKGKPVPIYVSDGEDGIFDAGDYIEFYGEFSRFQADPSAPDMYLDPYSFVNVYWLEWGHGRGTHLVEEEGLVLETDPSRFYSVYSFPSKIHYEKDRHFDRLSQFQEQTPRDHWFLDPGIFSSEKKEYQLDLPDPDDQSDRPVTLRIMLHGQTFSPDQPHRVEVFFNQRLVMADQWFGQTPKLLSSLEHEPIPANTLDAHRNSVTLVNRASPAEIDNFFVNWIEVTYPRLLRAHKGALEFTIPEGSSKGLFDFQVRGFLTDQISIYKLGTSTIIGADIFPEVDENGDTTYVARFQDEVFTEKVRYFAVEAWAKLKPDTILLHEPVDLRDPSLAGDYVVIAYDSLANSEPLQQLVNHRRQQGHQVVVVPVSEVFNQFSYGLFSPEGIRNFLRYAYTHWPTPPKYVLLVGDGSYDNRDIRRGGGNLIPVHLRQMQKYGAAVSDHWYSLMNPEDELPDVFLGRLPVNSVEELQILVSKIIEYETMPEKGEWLNRILLLGGNGLVFRQQSEFLISSILPTRLEIHRLYTYRDRSVENDPYFGGTSDLLEYVNDGVFLVNFMGHGGGAIWADNSLMRLEDVERLNNKGRYPIITSMTCFTGAFDNPFRQTLAEKLLLQPDAGSPAIWASSGLGWTREDFNIVRELFDLLARYGSSLTLGEYLAAAKVSYIAKHLDAVGFSILNQYNLLGDPAMRLQLPEQNIELSLDRRAAGAGDTLTVQGRVEFDFGDGKLQVLNASREVIASMPITISGGVISARPVLPETLNDNNAYIRVYARSSDGQFHASNAERIGLNHFFLDSLYTNLAEHGGADSLRFFARVQHTFPLRESRVLISYPVSDTLAMTAATQGNLLVSRGAFRPLKAGEVIRFALEVEDVRGNRFVSELHEAAVPLGPDLLVSPNYFSITGDNDVVLQGYLFNIGDAAVAGAEALFEKWNDRTQTWETLQRLSVALPAKDRLAVRVPLPPVVGSVRCRITLDPENQIAEFSETNNQVDITLPVEVFLVRADLGSTLSMTTNDTIAVDHLLRFVVSPEAVRSNTVLRVKRSHQIQVIDQPDFHPVLENGRPVVYDIASADNFGQPAIQEMALFFRADTIQMTSPEGATVPLLNMSSAGVCRYDSVTQKWIRLPFERHPQDLTLRIEPPARIGLFLVEDRTPPKVEITVEGQLFSEGGFVPAEPVITIMASDMNGIDLSPQSLRIFVDEIAWPYEQLVVSDSAGALNAAAITLRPRFDPGDHTVRAIVRDAAGNDSDILESHFRVAAGAKLRFLGNYPNPFENRTTFAYELSDHARDLELKIYTSSGQLIRTINAREVVEDPNPLGPNYHEITWDARDGYGERVANGLYYFKLRVVFREGVQEYVGKIARLK